MLPRLDMFEADLRKLLELIDGIDPNRQGSIIFDIRKVKDQAADVKAALNSRSSESDFHGRI